VNPLRLVLVTQRFWPLAGGAQRLTANLAIDLAGRGCEVTVLSARWNPSWPTTISLHGVPVVRMPHAPHGRWGTFRYHVSLARWLRRNADRFDLACVSTLQREAYVALRAVGRRMPVVLRAERPGEHGDCRWQAEARCGRRIARCCKTAAAVIAPSRAVEQELTDAGYDGQRIRRLSNGVPLPPPRTPACRAAARAALAEAHPTLELQETAPLAVCVGGLHARRGLWTLVAAWEAIVARWPNARLWLVGEGPEHNALLRQIEMLNLTGRAMPIGAFDATDELLAAADLLVAPSPAPGTGVSLLEALAAGLPVVAADTAFHRQWITAGREGLLVPPEDTAALSAAVHRLIDEPQLAAALGASARQRAEAEFPLAKMTEEHLTLFRQLTSRDDAQEFRVQGSGFSTRTRPSTQFLNPEP
jgi:glycosyltransferase involved in cell wall biosynthesis